jgi:aminomethyltransferase
LLNAEGGILDDLMVARPADPAWQGILHIVVNAGTKEQDFGMISRAAAGKATLRVAEGCGLLALQGPHAHAVMVDVLGEAALPATFMQLAHEPNSAFGPLWLTRSGYTGEDGFEVLVQGAFVEALCAALLTDARVQPIGLGARDSLRLEAGLCLYGHDLDAGRSPIEADLKWVIQKRRREAADFPGAKRILEELAQGPKQLRVGIKVLGRLPAREGAEVLNDNGAHIGALTSGGFGPSVQGPVGMGYVEADHATLGTKVQVLVRGKALEAEIVALPFVAHRYRR